MELTEGSSVAIESLELFVSVSVETFFLGVS
jgi:hypothetical protein